LASAVSGVCDPLRSAPEDPWNARSWHLRAWQRNIAVFKCLPAANIGPRKNYFCDGYHIAREMTPVSCRIMTAA
jgi:hypothetical protein